MIHRMALIAAIAAALLTGCSAPKKVPYLVDAENLPKEVLSQLPVQSDPIITVGDLLNIDVTGEKMDAVAPFNKGRYVDEKGNILNMNRTYNQYGTTGLEVSTEYYLVNADGTIDFPLVGKIEVAGKTKEEVARDICNAIYPKYVKEKPSVDIRLMNFRVTVAGAVRSPGVYPSKNERMTFLEAISMAGDLDIRGDRENILLYRTNPDGSREVHKLNLHDRNLLLSPYYTLQQNDFIYVTPNSSMRQGAWQLSPAASATITIVSGISSLSSLIVGIINLSK